MAKNVLSVVSDLASAVCEKNGCYLYDLEYQKEGSRQILRIFADKENGISIDECEAISRALSEELDSLNLIETSYQLEVSSPGVERKLTKDWHFSLAAGRKIEVSLYAPIDGKKSFIGILERMEEDTVHLICEGTPLSFPLDKIAVSKLYFDFHQALNGNE